VVGVLGIAFAFGLALIGMAYGIGPVSGCHLNPAVSLGVLLAGRMSPGDFVQYVIAQCLGAIAGAAVLYMIASGKLSGFDIAKQGLGQNGWGPTYLGGYGLGAAFLFEVVATFLFVVVILGATSPGAPSATAGLAIGLTLVVIHIVGIQITGVSVNPARSLGPALFAGGTALSQLWLFILAPLIGAAAAVSSSRAACCTTKRILRAPSPLAAVEACRNANKAGTRPALFDSGIISTSFSDACSSGAGRLVGIRRLGPGRIVTPLVHELVELGLVLRHAQAVEEAFEVPRLFLEAAQRVGAIIVECPITGRILRPHRP
jgi:aquaporin Z